MPTANQSRDLQLIRHIRQGSVDAKDTLVDKYVPMIKHIVKKYYASFLDFDDLMQEGFIGLLNAIDEYRPDDFDMKFSSFAYMCIMRKVFNVIKHSNGNKHKALNDALSLHGYVNSDETRTLLDLLPAGYPDSDPVERVEEQQISQRVDETLRNHLSALEYAVASMILKGYSSNEMERLIGVKSKVVDNARTRVKAKLKRLVDQYGSLVHPSIPTRVRRRKDLYFTFQIEG